MSLRQLTERTSIPARWPSAPIKGGFYSASSAPRIFVLPDAYNRPPC